MLVGITAATPGNTGHAALLIFLQPVRISPKCPDLARYLVQRKNFRMEVSQRHTSRNEDRDQYNMLTSTALDLSVYL